MSQYTKELHLKHVEAFWDGRLEHLSMTGKWETVKHAPVNDYNPECYRIRPKKVLRQWKPEEVPVGAQVRRDCHSSGDEYRSYVIDSIVPTRDGFRVYLGSPCAQSVTLASLLKNDWKVSLDFGKTWLPCGVEEEQQ